MSYNGRGGDWGGTEDEGGPAPAPAAAATILIFFVENAKSDERIVRQQCGLNAARFMPLAASTVGGAVTIFGAARVYCMEYRLQLQADEFKRAIEH